MTALELMEAALAKVQREIEFCSLGDRPPSPGVERLMAERRLIAAIAFHKEATARAARVAAKRAAKP